MNANEIATKQDMVELKEMVRQLAASNNECQPGDRLLSSRQVRAYLDNMSEGTLKKLWDEGELIPSKIMGKYFYKMEDIIAMYERNKGRR